MWDWLVLALPMAFPIILLPSLSKWVTGDAAGRAAKSEDVIVGGTAAAAAWDTTARRAARLRARATQSRQRRARGSGNNRTASGDSELKTARLPLLTGRCVRPVRRWSLSVSTPDAAKAAAKARDLARLYKGFADALRTDGHDRLARDAEAQSQWWLTYAVALSQIPPGTTKPEWER